VSTHTFKNGRGSSNRHTPAAAATTPAHPSAAHPPPSHAASSHARNAKIPVQSTKFVDPHFPFQPLPEPNGNAPYRFDLSNLLSDADVARIRQTGTMVFHTVGDTGDQRGKEMDFVSAMLTADYHAQPADHAPAFFYHLGDVVYFAGDVDKYGNNFYETYSEYPGLIVAIPGNHDCQPDDPQDGPVDPRKVPLDGWVQNFMSKNPGQLGSLKTSSSRTQMDLPNVYWTFTTPFATIIGLFSNVSETEAEIHPDQLAWFKSELAAADPKLALIVAIHHPPYSGDDEHSGSSVAEQKLFESFAETGRYPHLILSGHVHNYQRFTVQQTVKGGTVAVPCVVAGAGGYTKLGKLHKLDGKYPTAPLEVSNTLTLERYDQDKFGFLRLEVSHTSIVGSYFCAPYQQATSPQARQIDRFTINLAARTVTTG
jgi:hypothetical protein